MTQPEAKRHKTNEIFGRLRMDDRKNPTRGYEMRSQTKHVRGKERKWQWNGEDNKLLRKTERQSENDGDV